MYYNVRVKRYSDGTMQYMFSERAREKGYTEEEKNKTGETVERKKIENKKRAKEVVYDLARHNRFDWFITLTFDPAKVNSYDYAECTEHIKRFTDLMLHRGYQWLLVPELHESGRYHFHGLVRGDLPVVPAKSPYTGKLLVDAQGRQIYNISMYKLGHTTATAIDDPAKTANYIAKYLTKELAVPKGKKSYWASKSLARPQVDYMEMYAAEFGEIFNYARYSKVIDSPYGKYLFCET